MKCSRRGEEQHVAGAIFKTRSARRLQTTLAIFLFLTSLSLAQQNQGAWEGPWSYSGEIETTCEELAEISHAALLPVGLHQGKVLLWSRQPDPSLNCSLDGTSNFWLFDPDHPDNLILIEQTLQSNIFCSGASWDPIGRLVVVGGIRQGPKECYRFRPRTLGRVMNGQIPVITGNEPWIQLSDLFLGRYYPGVLSLTRRRMYVEAFNSTTTTVDGGAHLVLGGPDDAHAIGGQDVWEWIPYGATPQLPSTWPHPIQPHVQAQPKTNGDSYYEISGTPVPDEDFDSYPRAFQVSSEDILVLNDVDTNGAANPAGESRVIRVDYENNPPPTVFANRWELWNGKHAGTPCSAGGPTNDRNWGSAVLFHMIGQNDRVLVFGGYGDNCSGNTVINDSVQEFKLDPSSMAPTAAHGSWRDKQPLTVPRENINCVILPTGEVVVTGGNSLVTLLDYDAPIFYPELYNIGRDFDDDGTHALDTNSTTAMAESNVWGLYQEALNQWLVSRTPRMYHHVALLLLDGRILVAGGTEANSQLVSGKYSAELFHRLT